MITSLSRVLPLLLAATLLTACSDGSDSSNAAGPRLSGCADTGTCQPNPTLPLDGSIEGAETSVTSWPGCLNGTAVDFWKMNDGVHIPTLWVPESLDRFTGWILEHPRN